MAVAAKKVEDPVLAIEYVALSKCRRWERNPKLHDIGALIQSFQRYGFRDPPAYDPTLNDGTGGIVEGNGRIEALMAMKKDDDEKPPPGVQFVGKGKSRDWAIPILFGVDAGSQAEAEAYAIDHNSLVLSGGRFGPGDAERLWELDDYISLVEDLALIESLPVTVDGDDLDALLHPKLPDPKAKRIEHSREGFKLVEVWVPEDDLSSIEPTLTAWSERDGFEVHIS